MSAVYSKSTEYSRGALAVQYRSAVYNTGYHNYP
jgi:hypothetical protein